LLCTVFVTAVFSGCKKKDDNYSFSVFVPWAITSNPYGWESYNEFSAYKELAKRTGIEVDYFHSNYDQLQYLLAGNDYPEVMILSDNAYGGSYPGGVEKGISDGVILDLSQSLPQYAPNYLAAVDNSTSSAQFVKTASGKYAQLYLLHDRELAPSIGYVMREDWLRQAGFVNADQTTKVPLTYAEWTTYLTYVKSHNLNGGSKFPLYVNMAGYDMYTHALQGGFGATGGYYQTNGTAKYGALEDDFWAYLDQARAWFEAGLIEPTFSQFPNPEPYGTKPATVIGTSATDPAQYAAFLHYSSKIKEAEELGKAYDPNYKLIAVPAPVKTLGDTVHLRLSMGSTTRYYAVITNKCKNPQKVLEWFNYVFSDEGTMLMNFGIEGDTYTLVDGKPKFTAKITDDPNVSPGTMANINTAGNVFIYYSKYREDAYPNANQYLIQAELAWTTQCDDAYLYPDEAKALFTEEEKTTLATIASGTQMGVMTMYVYKIVAGSASTYAKTAAEARAAFGATISPGVAIYQRALEEYNALLTTGG
jgi:putative aldouronate transport system substrate-binding protein